MLTVLRAILTVTVLGIAGCGAYQGAAPYIVVERYGEPDLMAWETSGSPEYSTRERPGAMRCGNEPGTLRYYYLERSQVIRFDGNRLVAVDHLDDDEKELAKSRISALHEEAPEADTPDAPPPAP